MMWKWQYDNRRPHWDEYFLMMAQVVATRATCDRGPEQKFRAHRGTGTVIVSPDRKQISIGYNGSPPGQPHCDDTGHLLKDGHCLTGDTLISKFQNKRYNTGHRSIEYIYNNWQNYRQRGPLKRMKIRMVNAHGMIVPGHIQDIWYTGKQPVFQVTTQLGRTLTSTEDHLYLTPEGYKPLYLLEKNSSIALNGEYLAHSPEWITETYLNGISILQLSKITGLSRHCITSYIKQKNIDIRNPNQAGGWNRGLIYTNGCKGRNVNKDSARERARRYFLENQCAICGATHPLHLHHIDKDPWNDIKANLITLCPECHWIAHTPHAHITRCKFDKIIDIKPKGVQRTYDLTTTPHHNFVANGIIVHNCVKTLHSEENAILNASFDLTGATLYVTTFPCYNCAKRICSVKIRKVCYINDYKNDPEVQRLFLRANISIEQHKIDIPPQAHS